jgi:hypothetical protein
MEYYQSKVVTHEASLSGYIQINSQFAEAIGNVKEIQAVLPELKDLEEITKILNAQLTAFIMMAQFLDDNDLSIKLKNRIQTFERLRDTMALFVAALQVSEMVRV